MILDGYKIQYVPFVCPECNCWMTSKNIVGEGNYPLNTFKSNGDKAIGFECPKCFTKSVCHKKGYKYER